ncbi:hypothetical protein MCUN1_000330 [Malassezia cuniculi]|uniref:ATPase dynein-related AAA domain-containing protein n=1 Tax=Malassezia cuniculi TaxID=948313 RepID=A0AAF0EV67_9BASI|nr:hypothetical protein MCUN1_000330 [Malassezia cuniculi]
MAIRAFLRMAPSMRTRALARADALVRHMSTSAVHSTRQDAVGSLNLGPHVSIPVHATDAPDRVPPARLHLDLSDPLVLEHLEFLGKKWQLGQDVFFSAPPGPYARRLFQTFAALIQVPVEYVAMHRDIGEAELIQSRNLDAGGSLRYDDGPVVRAMKHGRILVIEGIERAERGVMPILNNILENREHNLPDGTQLVPSSRAQDADAGHAQFIPVHPDFRVFCVGLPVPPYRGHPLDPPFRSRFQSRWVEGSVWDAPQASPLARRWGEWAALLRAHSRLAQGTATLPQGTQLPHLPDTALPMLTAIAGAFPAVAELAAPRAPASSAATPAPQTAQTTGPAPLAAARSTLAMLATAYPALLDLTADKARVLDELLVRAGLDAGVGESCADPHAAGAGLAGYRIVSITRRDASTASLVFEHVTTSGRVELTAPCGPLGLREVPALGSTHGAFIATPRLLAVLSHMLQMHALGYDLCVVPGLGETTHASSSRSTAISLFAQVLGYQLETVWLWKDMSGNELVMRRATTVDGATVWEPAPLTQGALDGTLVHLAGVDVLGATLGSLSRLTQDRELELWGGARLSLGAVAGSEPGSHASVASGGLTSLARRFRLVASAPTATKWLSEDVAAMFATVTSPPMDAQEERHLVLARSGCAPERLEPVFEFAKRYRAACADPGVGLHKARRLGTRQLIRVATRMARFARTDVHAVLWRGQLVDFLPRTVREIVASLLRDCGIVPHGTDGAVQYIPPLELSAPRVDGAELVFYDAKERELFRVPRYDWRSADPAGASLVPNAAGSFFHNPQQSAMLLTFVQDLVVLGEHMLLMGAQGTGKNKLIDQTLELLDRPREYIQLSRDSTVGELLQRMYLEDGQLRYAESPLVRAVRLGRVLVVDEVDKCSPAVSAVFKSLAERGELSLPDGRRVRPHGSAGADHDVIVHPDFRLVLLANRPGWPFLGNSFTEVIGDGFSPYAVANPDVRSELALLRKVAPKVRDSLLYSLVMAFHDLRAAFEKDEINHPYSLRELLHLARHLNAFPDEPLGDVLLNVLAFDLHKPEALRVVLDTLERRGLVVGDVSIEALQERAAKKEREQSLRVEYKPLGSTSLDKPKEGKDDPNNDPHVGGNTWRGGTGGRDTAGLGGRGGFERLYKGHKIHQIPDELKRDVPEHIAEQAREMARQALAEKLKSERIDPDELQQLLVLKKRVAAQVTHLASVLESLTANEHERTWFSRQQEGQLDERRLGEGLTGERAIFKRRAEAPPEIGAPQLKPKRIRIVLDASASMYHMQFDGRLARELETALMVLEAFARVDPDRFAFDMVAHCGDTIKIPLVRLTHQPKTDGDRFRILRDVLAYTRFCMSGDYTLECIEESIKDVRETEDADDYFVIALSDANLARYNITSDDLGRVLRADERVKTAVIFIDKGPEAVHAAHDLPGRAFVAQETKDIPRILSDILTSMLDRN